MTSYVEHDFVWPETWASKADEDGWLPHVEGVLRREAIDNGLTLIGAPEQVGEPEQITVNTSAGPVRALRAFYRAAVHEPIGITTDTVEATETAPGVWEADVPGNAPIVSVRHGLNTLAVDVDALDADGKPTGYHGFPVPISPQEVEIVPSATTRHLIVTLVPEDDDGTDQREPGEPALPATH